MADELAEIVKRLNEIDEQIDTVSKEWVVLKHEYRRTRDTVIKLKIKKKWDALQKKMETLEKRHRQIIEKKNEIDYKRKWKQWK